MVLIGVRRIVAQQVLEEAADCGEPAVVHDFS